jgi:hypothetical protein
MLSQPARSIRFLAAWQAAERSLHRALGDWGSRHLGMRSGIHGTFWFGGKSLDTAHKAFQAGLNLELLLKFGLLENYSLRH